MAHLEENMRRLGLLHKYMSLLHQLISIIQGKGSGKGSE